MMSGAISKISWHEKSEAVDELLNREDLLTLSPMNAGLEAEVVKICSDETKRCFVLKIWNRNSKPDIAGQYKLTSTLYNRGIAIPRPLGWGVDEKGSQVLLTEYGGSPIQKLDKKKLTTIARLLTAIHQLPPDAFDTGTLRKHDFIDYFYPGINGHPDIQQILSRLVHQANLTQDSFIHGDYNLQNVLETGDGQYTIIDWTNGQLGDPRYDMAWSIILIRIYAGERNGSVYRSAFLTDETSSTTREELELFEAIACLRWILLNRLVGLPKTKTTLPTVKNILRTNAYLPDDLI